MSENPATFKQRAIACRIRGMTMRDGYPPTLRELAREIGTTFENILAHLRLMKKKQIVDWEPGKAGTLRVTG